MCLANSQKFNELLDPENDASKLEAKQTESVLIFYKFLIINTAREGNARSWVVYNKNTKKNESR